jgi:hypothetical protein
MLFVPIALFVLIVPIALFAFVAMPVSITATARPAVLNRNEDAGREE